MKILKSEPIIVPIAEMNLISSGVVEMAEWVKEVVPGAIPAAFENESATSAQRALVLFPHGGRRYDTTPRQPGNTLTDNELLVELAGRKCYDSFGDKAGRKSNKEYIENTQQGAIPHASIMYHAKMSFFIAGVSRRVSHELIRHYVGADRDEEGSPSQQSTRYCEHPGRYIAHPAILDNESELLWFERAMGTNHRDYMAYVQRRTEDFFNRTGEKPKGLDRKRILESASPYLSHACETSWVWTTNPIAMAKLIRERDNEAADLEFARLAKKWKRIVVERWPNLFVQEWMR